MARSKGFVFAWLLFLLIPTGLLANDTAWTLRPEAFLAIVRQYHPVVKQSILQVERAAAELLQARGGFDPYVSSSLERKEFDGTLYYDYREAGLNIPTWYGVELRAGVADIRGDRVTSEATLGKTNYVGVRVPVNNLIFDRRRAALRQARTMQQLSRAEQVLIVNDLLLEGLAAYWDWVREYNNYLLVRELIRVNEERLRFLRIEFEQGARPAIDTTETLAQLQQLYAQQQNNFVNFSNAGLELGNFLWLEDGSPVAWNERIQPDSTLLLRDVRQIAVPAMDSLVTDARVNHPKIRSVNFEIDFLEIERRLKAQSFIPKLDVTGNFLNKGFDVPKDWSGDMISANYQFKIGFQIPIFLREARGAFQATRLGLRETGLKRDQLTLEIVNKIRSYANELQGLLQQLDSYERATQNYLRLYQGERLRFDVGESTLFLLNARENKLLEMQQKLVEVKTKWHKARAGYLWSAGRLF